MITVQDVELRAGARLLLEGVTYQVNGDQFRAKAGTKRGKVAKGWSRTAIGSVSIPTAQLVITDVFLLASAPNDRQVRAVVDAVEEAMRDLGAKPVRREGEQEGRWVLLDFAEVVIHVQHQEERVFYALERLWKDCPVIEFVDRDARTASRTQVAP